jgi:hypothetical protein
VFYFVALVRVQDGGADTEERGVGGCWGFLRAPDDAVQDGRGHEGAVEEGGMGHGGAWRRVWLGR